MESPPQKTIAIVRKPKIKGAVEKGLEKEKNNANPKLNRQASMAPRSGGVLSEEEIKIAMEVAARILVRIRNGDLAKDNNEVVAQQYQVEKIIDESPSFVQASDEE